MESTSGIIEDLSNSTFEKDGETKQRWKMTINDMWISGFGDIPEPVKKAYEEKNRVRITYETKGQYRNYKNLQLNSAKKTEEKPILSYDEADEAADKLTLQNMIEANSAVMQECLDAATTLWARVEAEATTEDVRATAITLFMETMHDLNKLSTKQRFTLKGYKGGL